MMVIEISPILTRAKENSDLMSGLARIFDHPQDHLKTLIESAVTLKRAPELRRALDTMHRYDYTGDFAAYLMFFVGQLSAAQNTTEFVS